MIATAFTNLIDKECEDHAQGWQQSYHRSSQVSRNLSRSQWTQLHQSCIANQQNLQTIQEIIILDK